MTIRTEKQRQRNTRFGQIGLLRKKHSGTLLRLEQLEERLLLHADHGGNALPVLDSVADVGTTVDNPVEFLLTATDTDGDPLTFVASTPQQFPVPANEFAVIPVDGRSARVRVTPVLGFVGQIQLRVGARDEHHGTDAAAFSTRDLSLTVGVNQSPHGNNLNLRFGNDRSQTITLAGDDGDATVNQSLTFMINTMPQHGSLTNMSGNPITAGVPLTGTQVMYRAAQGYTGPNQFTYHVQDDGGTAGGGTNRSVQAAQAILTVTGQTTQPPGQNPPGNNPLPGALARLVDGVLAIRGSDGDDTIVCALSEDEDRIECRINDELLDSFDLSDVRHIRIHAGAGNDEIEVDPDITIPTHIRCGRGDDTVTGGGGLDVIRGGRGDDMLDGGEGDDRLHGRRGHDMLMGGDGDDILCGGSGHDSMEGGEGDDHFRGGYGRDAMDGGPGRDRMHGGDGHDLNMAPDAADHAADATWHQTFGPADGPIVMMQNDHATRARMDQLEHVASIGRDPGEIPSAPTAATSGVVKVAIEAKEVIAEITPGVTVNYWTFAGGVPGPFLRVRQGDRVELTLHNNSENMFHHNIDLHAVTGPGGGASVTNVAPGESATFTFRALNPGLFVYHCAHPNMAEHMAHGMYGLILVEPTGGLPPVDEEFYVMQGEAYVHGAAGANGFRMFDAERMMDDRPSYFIFNGRTGEMVDRMTVDAGDDVRIFFGNGGVNRVSTLHIVGETFDRVYPEAAIGSDPVLNTGRTIVPAGGATIVELTADAPGEYLLVDQSLGRADHGAWGVLEVVGAGAATVAQHTFDPVADLVLSRPHNHASRQALSQLDHLASIAHDPNDLPAAPVPATGDTVKIDLEAKEVIAEISPGVMVNYWTFDGSVPGPFLRVREGDRVELTLHNNVENLFHHSIDLSAVAGLNDSAVVTGLAPGESESVTFQATNPGLYVYGSVSADAAEHNAHGMFGLLLVEPAAGLSPVDKEYYVMQAEFYVSGALGQTGLRTFDADGMLDGRPTYIVFNGTTGALMDQMTAEIGDAVRIYFGNGGVNLTSSFHVVGEIFDRVYPEGAIGSDPLLNVQTTAVPPGGATVVEFNTEVPGRYVLVDHALARTDRGAWGLLEVMGEENHDIFDGAHDGTGHDHGAGGH